MTAADLVLTNARVITLDPHKPFASLVAIQRDTIKFVGDPDDLGRVSGAGTKVLDCEGRTVVPGFIDAHCHVFSFLRKLLSVDLSPQSVRSIDDIKQAVRKKAEQTPIGEWINGTDYNDFYLAEKRHPTRWEIDEVVPDHPVVLSHRSLHACVLNSRALALAGITRETEEPPGGTIERDLATGEPDGLLLDMLGYIREQVMPGITGEEIERGIKRASTHYLSRGITSLQDATVVNDYARWQKFIRFKEQDLLKSRLWMMVGTDQLDEFRGAGLGFGSGNNNLRLGGVKITPSETGDTIYPPQPELDRMVLDIHRAGFRVAIHAIRHETVEAAVTAIERALAEVPVRDHRHRIEHCSECPPWLLERLKRAGVVVVTQPPFLFYSGERYLATVPADRLPWLYRIRSLTNAGLTVAGSSDSPIVDDNPLIGIHSAVNRCAETGQPVLPEEGISPLEALRMYTANAAYASFDEHRKGTVTEGKLADLVLLSDDPVRVTPEAIADINVVMTILGGEVAWES